MFYKINLAIVLLLFSTQSRSQHVEYNFGIGSGLFQYSSDKMGRMEPYYSMINVLFDPGYPENPYANNPLGNRSGLSFQFYEAVKKVTKRNFLWGLTLELQSLQSRKQIRNAFDVVHDTLFAATGHSKLRNTYIDLFPHFGHRIILKKIYLDITGGLELAMNFFGGHEKASAEIISTHQLLTADFSSRSSPVFVPFDGRIRLHSLLGYHQWGVTLGYSWGLINIDGSGSGNSSHSRYASLGIVYTLKH